MLPCREFPPTLCLQLPPLAPTQPSTPLSLRRSRLIAGQFHCQRWRVVAKAWAAPLTHLTSFSWPPLIAPRAHKTKARKQARARSRFCTMQASLELARLSILFPRCVPPPLVPAFRSTAASMCPCMCGMHCSVMQKRAGSDRSQHITAIWAAVHATVWWKHNMNMKRVLNWERFS